MADTVGRLNAVADLIRAETYLEIGVSHGHTFAGIKVAERTAVDPLFRFDPTELANDTTHFHEVESDHFFQTLPVTAVYDLIFIDGLHKFEQVIRDLTNSILHSHMKTVFLMDDTVPTDIYSAVPDMQEAFRLREQLTETNDGAWHGDVYKVIFFIHDFCPNLNYRTVLHSGNPQTLIWRSNKFIRKPRFDSLETISRLSYLDMVTHMDVMREATWQEALDICAAELP